MSEYPSSDSIDEGASEMQSRLLRAAIDLFEEKGYPVASVREIADRAAVSKGAFYHWFKSKEDVLHRIHDQFIDEQLSQAELVIALGLRPDLALTRLIEDLMDSVERHHDETKVFIREHRFLAEDAFTDIQAKRRRLESMFTAVIDQGIGDGIFRSVESTRVLAFGIMGMCAWATEWFRPGPMSAREVGAMYARVLVDGLRSEA
jgi:AcrR family transcriptional regulator